MPDELSPQTTQGVSRRRPDLMIVVVGDGDDGVVGSLTVVDEKAIMFCARFSLRSLQEVIGLNTALNLSFISSSRAYKLQKNYNELLQ